MKGKKKNSSKKLVPRGPLRPQGLVTIPKNVWGIASSLRVNLTYSESFLTTALSGYLTYRGNDCFDPQATASGITPSGNQQPQFFDVWKLMYNKYCVLASTITVRIVNGSNPIPTFWEVSPEDQLVATSNAVQASVARFAKTHVMPYGSSTPAHTFETRMTTATINGISEARVLSDDEYRAATNQSPVDPWYWQIRYSAADFTTTAVVYGSVRITFDVLWSDPVQDDDNDFLSKVKALVIEKQPNTLSKDEEKEVVIISPVPPPTTLVRSKAGFFSRS